MLRIFCGVCVQTVVVESAKTTCPCCFCSVTPGAAFISTNFFILPRSQNHDLNFESLRNIFFLLRSFQHASGDRNLITAPFYEIFIFNKPKDLGSKGNL